MARGGVRPNSGRGTVLDDMKLADILNASSDVTLRFVTDESIPIEKRVEVASRLLAKRIPNDVNLGGQINNPINNILTFRWLKDGE